MQGSESHQSARAPAADPAAQDARHVYRGQALRAVAMPLGGLGTGSIALAGDGSLRQWQIHNQVNHLACLPDSFFAVWAKQARSAAPPVARVLQSQAFHSQAERIAAPPTVNDHQVPPTHEDLLARLPGVQATEFAGAYPIAEIAFHDPALPIDVTLEAFSPFVPLDAGDSGLPSILFNFTLRNPTSAAIHVALAGALQNAAGWDGVTPVFGANCFLYGGNSNTLARFGDLTAVIMSTTRLQERDAGYGSLVLGVFDPAATYLTQWDDLAAFWSDFSSDGRLSNVADTTPSPAGRTWNGALAAAWTLEPGAAWAVSFMLAWHFPNHYVNYSQRTLFGFDDDKSRFWIGHAYSKRFRSALDVAAHVQKERPRLVAATRLVRTVLHDTTLPRPLIEAVTSQISILRSPTCFWAEDGRFYGFEGCNGASTPHSGPVGGCCPLNCTHVWNYEMALARLFPALERTMRDTEWDLQQHPSGYLPHRVTLPLFLPRPWERKIGGPDVPALDGLLGAILKTYREYRACGDRAWLGRAWPAVKRALGYVWQALDPDRAGLITGEQPNTYDISIYGANTFIGTLYLAALRAVEVMAGLFAEDALAAECRDIFRRGRDAIEARLWNGEYYIQEVDLAAHPEHNWGAGCHSDQLLGQWWAHSLDLGYLLDPEHVRTAARSIVRYNFRQDFHTHRQEPRVYAADGDRGLLVCTWPNGGRPAVPTLYSDEVWTGIEYEVAGLLLYEGEAALAYQLVAAARDRHDGTTQNPWNDVECGDHYVRALSSWSLLEAASGFRYDAALDDMAFAPKLTPDDYRGPFVAREGWGTFGQRLAGGTLQARIGVAYGSLTIARLRLESGGVVVGASLRAAGQPIDATWSQLGGTVDLRPSVLVELAAGQDLVVELTLSLGGAA